MFHLRDKAGQRRPKGADDGFDAEEKPFLDHLEDLRTMFFKMLVTVVLTVTAASIFNVQLVELIQLPVKWAGIGKTDAMSAIFNLKHVKEPRFQPGELVLLQGGLIAKIVTEDVEARGHQAGNFAGCGSHRQDRHDSGNHSLAIGRG